MVCIYSCGGTICWKSSIHIIVAMSTTEEEYTEVAEVVKEALWLTSLVKELGIKEGGVQLHYDNHSVIYLVNNQVYHSRINHIDVGFHNIKEFSASEDILL